MISRAQHSQRGSPFQSKATFDYSVEFLLFGALFLALFTNGANGKLVLTPSSDIPLCPGDQLHLTCNSSSFLVQWTVYDTYNGMNYSRNTAATPSGEITRPETLQVNSFTFNISTQVVNITGSSNLSQISNITVDNVGIALNATVIICTEVATGIHGVESVNVIDTNEFIDISPEVNISDPVFGISNVTVDIAIQQNEHSNLSSLVSSLVMYKISISSTIESDMEEYYVKKIESFTYKVMVPYNMQINVSIVPTLCGRSLREVPIHPPFYYTHCGHPLFSNSIPGTGEMSVKTIPVTEGSIFNLTCPPGQILTGPNETTCMENGKWKPDPSQAKCIEIFSTGCPMCLRGTTNKQT